jgi:hypothetical protein
MPDPGPSSPAVSLSERPKQSLEQSSGQVFDPLRAWLGLAVGALAIAGVFALLLALSRTPGTETLISWPAAFFQKGLVIHVVFSFVVWFTAMLGAMLVSADLNQGADRRVSWSQVIAPIGVAIAFPLLFIPALLNRGEPTLNNYVPAITDPLYYAGLIVLAVSIGAASIGFLSQAIRGQLAASSINRVLTAAAGAFVIALICFVIAALYLRGEPINFEFNEQLMWGGGHALQVVNTLVVVAAWLYLAEKIAPDQSVNRTLINVCVGILVLASLTALIFYGVFEPFSGEQTQAFTNLQYAIGPPAIVIAFAICRTIPRPLPWKNPTFVGLVLSMLLFAVGGGLGIFVDGADTRTPAHYHGVIASVTGAMMVLIYAVLLPRIDRVIQARRTMLWQLHLFFWGQLVACIGLFIAGGHGAPRKTAGEAQGLDGVAQISGLAMNGLGGTIAVIGGIMFIVMASNALLRTPDGDSKSQRANYGGKGDVETAWR